jgi:hypothetical protein
MIVPAGRTGAGDGAVDAVYDCEPVETFFIQTPPTTEVPCGILAKLMVNGPTSE